MNPFSFKLSLRFQGTDFEPQEITRGVQLIPDHSWMRGDKITTPKGAILSGIRKSSYWSHQFIVGEDLSFEETLTSTLTPLIPKKEFLRDTRNRGIDIELFIGIFCSENIGFTLSCEHAQLLSDLRISVGFDILPDHNQQTAEQGDGP